MFYTIYNNLLYIGHNIIYNYYLLLFSIFPNYFKDLVVNAKQTNDDFYNRMMFLTFNDEIYKKYNIDLIDIHNNILKIINNNNNNNHLHLKDDDKNSINSNDDSNDDNDDDDNNDDENDDDDENSISDFSD